jgi:hypothetical protein
MKKVFFIICLFTAACTMPIPKNQNVNSKEDAEFAKVDSIVAAEKHAREVAAKRGEKIFDSLKNKFVSQKDDFNDVIWYTHKRFGKYWPNRKTIYTEVRNDGYYNVISNYYADDWLFHTSIQVLVGDRKFETETVETYKQDNRHDNHGGMIWENVRYNIENRNILNAIADNSNETVKIRFNGKQFYNDATMTAADKKAIKESLLFAQALAAINNNRK